MEGKFDMLGGNKMLLPHQHSSGSNRNEWKWWPQ